MFQIPEIPDDIKINRITYSEITNTSPKMIGKNARRDDHGITARERLVRVFTNSGHEGFGVTRAKADWIGEQEAPVAIGTNPGSLINEAAGISLFGIEFALWDLIGQIKGEPVYALLGPSKRDVVDAYDGGLYFCDILYPEIGRAHV